MEDLFESFKPSQPPRMPQSATSAHNEHLQNGKRRTALISNEQAPHKRRSLAGTSAQAQIAQHSEAPDSLRSPSQSSVPMGRSSNERDWQPVTSNLPPVAQRKGFYHDAYGFSWRHQNADKIVDQRSHHTLTGSSIGFATFSKSKSVPQTNRSSAQVEESRDKHDSPSPEASIVATIPNSDSHTVLIEKLDCAMETDLWKHVDSFLLRYTRDHLTKNATDSEIRALVQLLSYPQRRSLESYWVNRFQKGRRRRILLVIGLVLRAVSDTTLECDACSTDEDLSRNCSTLRVIQPGHIVLKELVGGQCCHCVVRERECEKSLDTTEHSAQPTSSNAWETQDVAPELRQMVRRMFAITFFQAAAEDHKLSLPPSNGQYAEQCARNVERRVFESTISQKDYVIKKQAVLNNLNKLHGQAAAQWFPDAFHDRLPIQSLCATRMPSSPAREEPEAAFERLESRHFRNRRQDSSLHKQSRHPDTSTKEQQSA